MMYLRKSFQIVTLAALLSWGVVANASTPPSTPDPLVLAQQLDDPGVIREVQSLLTQLGYKPGPVDGQMGGRTTRAIQRFQQRRKVTVNGQITDELLVELYTATKSKGRGRAKLRSDPAIVTRGSPLHVRPDLNSATMATVPTNAKVGLERLTGPWAKIRLGDGGQGWLPARYVTVGAPAKSTKSSGGSSFLRGLTGWLSPNSKRTSSNNAVTMGIRGLQREDIEAAQPDQAALRDLETRQPDATAALMHAKRLGLQSRAVAYPASSPGTGAAASNGNQSSGEQNTPSQALDKLKGFFKGSGGTPTTDEETDQR